MSSWPAPPCARAPEARVVTAELWGGVLTAAAVIALFLHTRRWRRGQVTSLQYGAGLIARAGFLVLGLLYATGLVYRWSRAPVYGLGVVGAGIVLHLTAGVIDNIRRARGDLPGDRSDAP